MRHGQLTELRLGETAADLTAVGFDDPFVVGRTGLRPSPGRPPHEGGIRGVSLRGIEELDGLPLGPTRDLVEPSTRPHRNGVVSIDHVVVMTPDPSRTQAAFEAAGLDARRSRRVETDRGTRRQTFFWFGDVICEVVGPDDGRGDGPAKLWGVALTVRDIEATHRSLTPAVTELKPAVQPGRRVCTLTASAVSTPILFISPHREGVGEQSNHD